MSIETTQRVPLIYPFMLIICAIVATLFCYLYLTASPSTPTLSESSRTEDTNSQPQVGNNAYTLASSNDKSEQTPSSIKETKTPVSPPENSVVEQNTTFQLPSDSGLPGEIKIKTSPLGTMPLAKSPALGDSVNYEQTNYNIQHVLDAQYGDSSQERITIEVPVLYQTRGMRWGPNEIQEASRILRAMEIYKGRVTQLKNDGHNIQKAWESLLTRSQPVSALRADSPSLPSNTKLNESLSNTSESINLSHE